jgi:hypothetical protein
MGAGRTIWRLDPVLPPLPAPFDLLMALQLDQLPPPPLLRLPVNVLPELAEVLDGAHQGKEDNAIHP